LSPLGRFLTFRHRAELDPFHEGEDDATEKPLRNRKERKELARRLRFENPGLEVVHPDAAAIDVGNEAHFVAVSAGQGHGPSTAV